MEPSGKFSGQARKSGVRRRPNMVAFQMFAQRAAAKLTSALSETNRLANPFEVSGATEAGPKWDRLGEEAKRRVTKCQAITYTFIR